MYNYSRPVRDTFSPWPFVRFSINNGFLMSQGVFGIPECPVEPEDDPCDRLREAFYPLIYSDLIQEHVAPAEVIILPEKYSFLHDNGKKGHMFLSK